MLEWDADGAGGHARTVHESALAVQTTGRGLTGIEVGDEGEATATITGMLTTWSSELDKRSTAVGVWSAAVSAQSCAVTAADGTLAL